MNVSSVLIAVLQPATATVNVRMPIGRREQQVGAVAQELDEERAHRAVAAPVAALSRRARAGGLLDGGLFSGRRGHGCMVPVATARANAATRRLTVPRAAGRLRGYPPPHAPRWRRSSASSSFACMAPMQVAQRLGARGDDPRRALDRHLAGEPVEQRAHLVLDQRLERLAVAQRVEDGEAERLVVAGGAEARDRLDDLHVLAVVAAAVRRQHRDLGEPVEHVLRDAVALARLRLGQALARSARRARARGCGPRPRPSPRPARGRGPSRP